jgi:hypothetical protein
MAPVTARRTPAAWLLAATLLAATTTGPRAQGSAQILLQEAFTGPTAASAVLTLNTAAPGFPCLTADPTGAPQSSTIPTCALAAPDPIGAGALRFTEVVEQQASGFVAATSLPTAQGLSITFTQYQYGGYGIGGPGNAGGADGIAFFLAVAPPHPQALGPQGGALGYAAAGSTPGLPGGWLGIGLDAFGNFSNPTFGNAACPVPAWAGFTPDAVTVRGPGHGTEGYCLLASSADENSPLGGGIPGATLRGDDRASAARRVRVDITPDNGLFGVYVDAGDGFELTVSGNLPDAYYDPTTGALVAGLPPRITFGFSASTGSATDIHEITDLTATTITGGVPVLGLTKTTTLAQNPQPGDGFSYVLTPRIDGAVAETEPLSLTVSDELPAGVSFAGGASGAAWTCLPTSPTAFTCRYGDGSPLAPGTVLPEISVPVVVDASVAPGTTIRNRATVLSADAAQPATAFVDVTIAAPPPPLEITTATLANGRVGTAYSASLAATGGIGARTWTLEAGALPDGLALSAAGTISGTPQTDGVALFTVRVTDAVNATATRALSIAVAPAPPPLVISTTSLPGGTVGLAYSATLAAAGGSGARSWTLETGALPVGLTLSPAGAITGTPISAGPFAFTVRVTDAANDTATQVLSITVAAPSLVITTTSLPSGTVGAAYAAPLAATGGTGARTWTLAAGGLPGGLVLSPVGAITGTPTTAGTSSFTVRVTDVAGATATRALSIAIAAVSADPVVITTTTLPAGEVGLTYGATLAATGGAPPLTWALRAGALPAGLTLSPAGVISGVPTSAGAFGVTIRATDGAGRFAQRSFVISVRLALDILTTSLPNGRAGAVYRAVLRHSGGLAPVTWTISAGTLPGGLALTADGVISGTPTAPGAYAFWVRAADALGGVAARRFVVTIVRAEKAYVAMQQSTCFVTPATPCPFALRAVELPSGRPVAIVSIPAAGLGARMLAAHPDGSRVFVVTDDFTAGPVLHEIDTTTDTVRRSLPIPATYGVPVLASDGTRLYSFARTPASAQGIGLVDIATFTYGVLSGAIGIGAGPLVVSPDGTTLYVAGLPGGSASARLLTIDVGTGTIARSLTLNYNGLLPGAITPGGGRVLLPYQFRNGAAERGMLDYRPLTNRVVGPIPSAGYLLHPTIPTPASLWAVEWGLPGGATVVNYSLLTDTLQRRVATSGIPDDLALNPARDLVYVLLRSAVLERIATSGGGATPVATLATGGFDTGTHLAIARAAPLPAP